MASVKTSDQYKKKRLTLEPQKPTVTREVTKGGQKHESHDQHEKVGTKMNRETITSAQLCH